MIRAVAKAEDHIRLNASPIRIARRSIGPSQDKGPPVSGRPCNLAKGPNNQALTLSFSAFAIENFTCLSAGLVTVSPVAGLRT